VLFRSVEEKEDIEFHFIKHWLLRPFQGIGIGLLFGTKLLLFLQIVTGEPATASLLIPTGQFQPGRFLIVTGITIVISLLLSTLWTLDDMGIRYFNRKNHEVRMIGKAVFSAFHNHFLQKRGKTLFYNLLNHKVDFRNE